MGDRLLAWGDGRTHREMPRASGGRPSFFTDADLHADGFCWTQALTWTVRIG